MQFLLVLTASLALASAASIPHDVAAPPRLLDTRIVGGSAVDIARHPHQISLRMKNILTPENAYRHDCGGSIIAADKIVTAAHCVIAKVASQFMVVAGANQRTGGDGVIVPVKQIIMHENYNRVPYDNDIALLILGVPLTLNNHTIKVVPLATSEPRVGAIATTTGWGALRQGGSAPILLQEVQVPIVSMDDCNEDYEGKVTDSMVCAGIRGVGGKDACQGDSGGPLLINGELAGVVSWGYGCADPDFPGIYAKVFYLLPWLLEKIAEVDAAKTP